MGSIEHGKLSRRDLVKRGQMLAVRLDNIGAYSYNQELELDADKTHLKRDSSKSD